VDVSIAFILVSVADLIKRLSSDDRLPYNLVCTHVTLFQSDNLLNQKGQGFPLYCTWESCHNSLVHVKWCIF
jgi:hypothetical protein